MQVSPDKQIDYEQIKNLVEARNFRMLDKREIPIEASFEEKQLMAQTIKKSLSMLQ